MIWNKISSRRLDLEKIRVSEKKVSGKSAKISEYRDFSEIFKIMPANGKFTSFKMIFTRDISRGFLVCVFRDLRKVMESKNDKHKMVYSTVKNNLLSYFFTKFHLGCCFQAFLLKTKI